MKLLYYWISLFCLMAALVSCSSPETNTIVMASIEQPIIEKIKPAYTIDLHVFHRRTPVSYTWRNIQNNAKVHFTRHGLIPMFRLFSVRFNPKDSLYEYVLQNAELKTYCKKKLVETNRRRQFGGTGNYLYSGQKGLLKCTDRETLSFLVGYRKIGDTLSSYTIDSIRYEIILDKDEAPESEF